MVAVRCLGVVEVVSDVNKRVCGLEKSQIKRDYPLGRYLVMGSAANCDMHAKHIGALWQVRKAPRSVVVRYHETIDLAGLC